MDANLSPVVTPGDRVIDALAFALADLGTAIGVSGATVDPDTADAVINCRADRPWSECGLPWRPMRAVVRRSR